MIYIIITTCVNSNYGINNYEHRKNLYIENINYLLNLIENNNMLKPIIVENNGLRPTYLDELNCDIVYTNNNSKSFNHKGVNELLDIKYIINKYNISDEDIIIKLTGRYKVLNNNFFNLIIDNINNVDNINNYDAFIKFFNVCTKTYMYNDCVLGLFAIKCKYMKKFNYINFHKSPEAEFSSFVRENVNKNKIFEVNMLYLQCCFANDLQILCV